MRWAAAALLAVAVAVASAVPAALVVRAPVPVTVTPLRPVFLAAGSGGTTTTGESGTSATTTGVLPLLNAQLNVLKLQRAGGAWDARLVLTGVTGEISTDLVTVQLAGATTSTQVVVRLGEDQTTGAPVALDAATGTVNVLTFGTCLGTCTLTMSIVLAPKGGAQPVLTYSYVLTVT